MSNLQSILDFNKNFVSNGEYIEYFSNKLPTKNLAILSCMDARMMELLHQAMGLKNGDAKVIKNAGAIVSHPWGSVMRSLLIAVYELGVTEIMVVSHYDCGAQQLNPEKMISKAIDFGIPQKRIDTLMNAGIDLYSWFQGFKSVEDSVIHTTNTIRNHPLMPKHICIHGLVIHPTTGQLSIVINNLKDDEN